MLSSMNASDCQHCFSAFPCSPGALNVYDRPPQCGVASSAAHLLFTRHGFCVAGVWQSLAGSSQNPSEPFRSSNHGVGPGPAVSPEGSAGEGFTPKHTWLFWDSTPCWRPLSALCHGGFFGIAAHDTAAPVIKPSGAGSLLARQES